MQGQVRAKITKTFDFQSWKVGKSESMISRFQYSVVSAACSWKKPGFTTEVEHATHAKRFSGYVFIMFPVASFL